MDAHGARRRARHAMKRERRPQGRLSPASEARASYRGRRKVSFAGLAPRSGGATAQGPSGGRCAGRDPGPPPAELQQRRDRLQHDVVDPHALELLLVLRVRGLQLLLRRLTGLVLLAHRACTSSCPGWAYVSRVWATVAANASRSV